MQKLQQGAERLGDASPRILRQVKAANSLEILHQTDSMLACRIYEQRSRAQAVVRYKVPASGRSLRLAMRFALCTKLALGVVYGYEVIFDSVGSFD